MDANVYQEIWDADQDTNGVPALRPGEDQSEELGWVVVDERTEEVGTEHRVLKDAFIPESKRETYDLCAKLYNNYALNPGVREDVTGEETQEEKDFIDAIVMLPPLQVAKQAIARQLEQSVSDLALAAMIKETWFLQGKAGAKHASGFEHVFVGEQKQAGSLPDATEAKLGGYHFWHKYYLDDGGEGGDDRMLYRGTQYGSSVEEKKGLQVPEVVTLEFRWTARDYLEGGDQLLKKPIGGFWVGPSPEGMIALGLVRTRTKANKIATINGATYQIDLHRLDDQPMSIRTFFPRFLRADFQCVGPGCNSNPNPNPDPVETAPGLVRIMAALVNPTGDDRGRETVTLLNTQPQAENLQDWALVAPNGSRFVFADVELAAGEVRTFRLPSSSAQLRNRGGDIFLLDASGDEHHQVSYSTPDAKRQGFTLPF